MKSVREYTITGLLVALSIVIPMFMPLKIIIPPFTMTFAAHVPAILSMFISPLAVVLVSIGNAIGFMGLGPIVVVRAASHVIFGLIGCYMVKKRMNYVLIILVTMIIHGLSEFTVIFGFSTTLLANTASIWATAYTTLFGTMLHHIIDFAISTPILIALTRTKNITYDIIRKG